MSFYFYPPIAVLVVKDKIGKVVVLYPPIAVLVNNSKDGKNVKRFYISSAYSSAGRAGAF